MLKRLTISIVLLVSLAFPSGAAPRVVFETDMGNDVDDVIALKMLYSYQEKGMIDLALISVNNADPFSVSFVRMMNRYYGHGDIPVASLSPESLPWKGMKNSYVQKVVESGRFSSPIAPENLDAVQAYRQLLSSSDDNGIVIISVGFSSTLAALLDSGPDEFCEDLGLELVQRKVRLLSLMGGNFRDSDKREFNIRHDIQAARRVLSSWPGDILISPWELGAYIFFKADWLEGSGPVEEAYRAYLPMPYDRECWDQTSVLAAIEPLEKYFTVSIPGRAVVDNSGHTLFEPVDNGNTRILACCDAALIEARIRELVYPSVTVPETAVISPGYFWMGSNRGGEDYDEAPVHRVTITKPFKMAVWEVTNIQYEQYDPSHRDKRGLNGFSFNDNEAVVNVSWYEAKGYCDWLSKKTGLHWRLPTEAEWEYAAKAGRYSEFWYGRTFPKKLAKNNDIHFHDAFILPTVNLEGNLHISPNGFGLYDMHGNVEEWCSDWYGPYQKKDQTDPVGYDDGEFKVTRGGSHSTEPQYLRSASRSAMLPEDRNYLTGFRVVQAPEPVTKPLHSAVFNENGFVKGDTPGKKKNIKWKSSESAVFMEPVPFIRFDKAAPGLHYYRHNHQPSVAALPNGDLIVAWFSTDREAGREMTVLASRLKYGAKEWDAPFEFYKVPDRNMTGTSLYYDSSGACLIHLNGVEAGGWWKNLAVVMRRSYDNGATWTRSKLVMPEHCPGHQLIAGMKTLSDGTLMQVCDATPDMTGGSIVWLSRDGGETWETKGGQIMGIHAGCVELSDGTLLAFGRGVSLPGDDGLPRMPVSRSTDRGATWNSSASPFPSIGGGQRLVLLRLHEGPLLIVSFDNSKTGPSGMFASLSYDEGQTWTKPKYITDGKEQFLDGGAWTGFFIMDTLHAEPRGYLTATQTPDGMIHLLSSRLHYRFNLAWLEQ